MPPLRVLRGGFPNSVVTGSKCNGTFWCWRTPPGSGPPSGPLQVLLSGHQALSSCITPQTEYGVRARATSLECLSLSSRGPARIMLPCVSLFIQDKLVAGPSPRRACYQLPTGGSLGIPASQGSQRTNTTSMKSDMALNATFNIHSTFNIQNSKK